MEDSDDFYDFDIDTDPMADKINKYAKDSDLYRLDEVDDEYGHTYENFNASTGDDKSKETTKIDFDRNQNIDTVNKEIEEFRKATKKIPIDSQSIGIGEGNVFEESSEEEDEEEEEQLPEIKPSEVQDYTENIAKISNPPLSTVSDPLTHTDIGKLMDQHNKLTSELEYLIQAIESQISKVKENKEKKLEDIRNRDKQPPEVRSKDKELKNVQRKVNKFTREIETMKRRLETTHSDETFVKLRNELDAKNATIKKMETEIASIKQVRKEQEKALKQFNSEDVTDDYVDRVKTQLAKSKAECKSLVEECRSEDRALKAQHNETIQLEDRCRKLEQYIRDSKLAKNKPSKPSKAETETELEYWIKKNEAAEHRQLEDYENKSKIFHALKARDYELAQELKLVQIKMKEKEQEMKLKRLKSREIKRQKPNGKLQPLSGARNHSYNRGGSHNNSMFNSNASKNSVKNGRNASATRIPSIRTSKKKKKFKMNQSLDAHPNSSAKMSKEGKLHNPPILNSSDSDGHDDLMQYNDSNLNYINISKELPASDFKKKMNDVGYKGYTPTGGMSQPNKHKKPNLPLPQKGAQN